MYVARRMSDEDKTRFPGTRAVVAPISIQKGVLNQWKGRAMQEERSSGGLGLY